MCHSRKNGWHLNKCVTVGKMGHTSRMYYTWKN